MLSPKDDLVLGVAGGRGGSGEYEEGNERRGNG